MKRIIESILFFGACALLCGCLGEYFGTTMPDRLREQGVSSEATIVKIWDTGWTVNDDPVIGMLVEVHPPDQPAFEATINRYIVSRIGVAQYQPGRTIRVRVDPADHTSIAVDNSATTAGADITAVDLAHTRGAMELAPNYDLPQIPSTLRGLRVLLNYMPVGDPASGHAEEPRLRGCREAALNMFDRVGWWLVHDSSETHDLVVQGECTTSASFLATDTGLYVLLPSIEKGMRIQTPTGEVIEQLQPIARTLKCPTRVQQECVAVIKEYVAYNFVGQVVGSRALEAFAELHIAHH